MLNARLDVIDEFLHKQDLLTDIRNRLSLYGDLDDILFGLAVKSRETSIRSIIQWIKNLVYVRQNITLVEALKYLLINRLKN